MAKFKTKSALQWFGSDARNAQRLGELLSDCKHVTIPFAGGLSILPFLRANVIVANDLHVLAYNFYRTLKGRFKNELIERCQETLSHPAELELSRELIARARMGYGVQNIVDPVELAWAFWAESWIGRKGQGGTKKPGGKASVRRTAKGGGNASRLKTSASMLEQWAEEFARCSFTCEDFRLSLEATKDNERNGLYVDPPWFGAGDSYLHSFEPEDHVALHKLLSGFRNTKVLVRYGDCREVRSLYSEPEWTVFEAVGRTQANKPLGEIWITRN